MFRYTLLQILEIVMFVIFVILPIRFFLFEPYFVFGESMYPNYENYDYLIVEKISYRFTEPKRGDVVIFKPPVNPNVHYIKRIIGLPNERVKIQDGKIYIFNKTHPNGFLLIEPYLENQFTPGNYDVLLKNDEYFVLGDNREESYDSRRWGPIKRQSITGRVLFKVTPLRGVVRIIKFGFLKP